MATPQRWLAIREQIELNPDWVYLNTGTSGLVPKRSHAASVALRTHLHHNPTDYVWRAHGEDLWRNRLRLASHLGTSPDRIVLFGNISHAINTCCLSLPLPAGSEIVMSDHEYGAMVWAWERAARRNGWTIKTFKLPIESENPDDYVEACTNALSSRTRLLYVSHILYTTGHVLPIAPMLQAAKRFGALTLVDGAHAPGMIPLELEKLEADFYAANLHKWAMVPVGAAFLYCRSGLEDRLAPWQVSWGYHDLRESNAPHEANGLGSTPWIRQFEMEGTRDITPWLLIEKSCDLLEEVGYPAIRERHFELSQYARDRFSTLHELQIVTPTHPSLRGGLTALRLPAAVDVGVIREQLWSKFRIEVNRIYHSTGDYLRISTHIYNIESEIDRLGDALQELLTTPP